MVGTIRRVHFAIPITTLALLCVQIYLGTHYIFSIFTWTYVKTAIWAHLVEALNFDFCEFSGEKFLDVYNESPSILCTHFLTSHDLRTASFFV